jgi:hypothetical protein
MRRKNKRGNNQKPACRVIWDYIDYQDCDAGQQAAWDLLWRRLLMPASPHDPEGQQPQEITPGATSIAVASGNHGWSECDNNNTDKVLRT